MLIYFIFLQSINENSLKQLSSYLETIQKNRPFKPTEIQFYLRPQGTIANEKKVKGKRILLLIMDYKMFYLFIHYTDQSLLTINIYKEYKIHAFTGSL